MLKVGDKVRFVDSMGGGIVTVLKSRMFAVVRDEDGLEIPVQTNRLVVVDTNLDTLQTRRTVPNKDAIKHRRSSTATLKLSAASGKGIHKIEVDLHIQQLTTAAHHLDNSTIIDIQLNEFHRIMRSNIHRRGLHIVFIHGVGTGVLQQAIYHALRTDYPRCTAHAAPYARYGQGATEVTIR